MTLVEEAALEVAALLDELQLRYMVIGGIAVGLWGQPRATIDLDVSIWVEAAQFEAVVDLLSSRLKPRTPQPLVIARRDRALPVRASNGVQVDILFASWPVEKQAFDRSVTLQVGKAQVRLAPLDYLLFLKLISERSKDLTDAEALLRRHRGTFDVSWLESELSALAESTAQPEIILRFQRLMGEP